MPFRFRFQRALAPSLLGAATILASLVGPAIRPASLSKSDTYAQSLCESVASTNTFDNGFMRPSPDYWDGNWLRDAFWTTGILGSDLGRRALDYFGLALNWEGQAPTRLGRNGAPDQYFDDESTLIYVIWAARDGGQSKDRIAHAWNWISRHVSEGAYWTPPGKYHTWHDTLVFPTADVVAYNQGLYALAAVEAAKFEVVDPQEAYTAVEYYRQLFRPDLGFMPVSLKLDYHDASVLTGETLARSLFGIAFLSDADVLATTRTLPRDGAGFLALSKEDGKYLPELTFSPPLPQGSYQNGGTWMLYDELTWTAAFLAGEQEAFVQAKKRLDGEAATGSLHEYLPTGPARDKGDGFGRPDYGANTFSCILMRQLETASFPKVKQLVPTDQAQNGGGREAVDFAQY